MAKFRSNLHTAFPLTTARGRRWWSHWRSLGSPDIWTSFFARQLKKGAVDLPHYQWFLLQLVGSNTVLIRL